MSTTQLVLIVLMLFCGVSVTWATMGARLSGIFEIGINGEMHWIWRKPLKDFVFWNFIIQGPVGLIVAIALIVKRKREKRGN